MYTCRPRFAEYDFRKSSFSNPNQDCVGIAQRSGWVELRDSKTEFGTPSDQRIVLTGDVFRSFLTVITRS
ncbi:DUF397 domain-containing protein [Actinophytocola oryzae]|uniref:Uncharacterized protein DUF397 n=1 Tax=Actinophytocola oryzae TaxID=502181 RepID=A0A4V3FRN0_9PSEU|nr:DUF397 domain-containing protein [Actinophytocola oryzae]TDV44181.1 uncharacterized protein DUF397 [Actinophytocola oryzae]